MRSNVERKTHTFPILMKKKTILFECWSFDADSISSLEDQYATSTDMKHTVSLEKRCIESRCYYFLFISLVKNNRQQLSIMSCQRFHPMFEPYKLSSCIAWHLIDLGCFSYIHVECFVGFSTMAMGSYSNYIIEKCLPFPSAICCRMFSLLLDQLERISSMRLKALLDSI